MSAFSFKKKRIINNQWVGYTDAMTPDECVVMFGNRQRGLAAFAIVQNNSQVVAVRGESEDWEAPEEVFRAPRFKELKEAFDNGGKALSGQDMMDIFSVADTVVEFRYFDELVKVASCAGIIKKFGSAVTADAIMLALAGLSIDEIDVALANGIDVEIMKGALLR